MNKGINVKNRLKIDGLLNTAEIEETFGLSRGFIHSVVSRKRMQTKARQFSYYKQLLNEIQNSKSGMVIVQMERNILCKSFEENRNNQDFVK